MQESPSITEAEILADVLGPDEGNLPADVAQNVLSWKFTDAAVSRINHLAALNSDGTISTRERQELENYLRVGNLINILQAKAQLSLKFARPVGP